MSEDADFGSCGQTKKPKEFWLAGEPNEHDFGIWYDHNPGVDVVYGKPFHRYHVIEKSAYDELAAELREIRAMIGADILKNKIQPYQKDMEEKLARLEAGLKKACEVIHDEFCSADHHPFCVEARSALEGARKDGEE
jgi:hypothetical protein